MFVDGMAALTGGLLIAVGLAIYVAKSDSKGGNFGAWAGELFASGVLPFVVGFGGVGWVLARRLAHNPIGWCFSLGGLMWAAGGFADAWARLAFTGHVELGVFARLCATVGTFGWIFSMPFSVQLPLLLLPNGRLLSRRWRPAVWAVLGGALIGAAGFATLPGVIGGTGPGAHVVNPMGLPSLGPLPLVLGRAGAVLLLAGMTAGAVAMVLRYRRARGVESQQMRWVALGGCLVLLGALTNLVPRIPSWASNVAGTLGILAVPVCVGIAVLRYRLYDLGRVVSRTVSYAVVTTMLLGIYLALVTSSSRLLPEGSSLSVAASTLAAAALFQPLRSRVQKVVDRRFNRERYDADRTIDTFTRHLRDEVELEVVRADLLQIVHDTLEPASAGLWLRPERTTNG